jgi:hypothetical protein
MSYVRMGQSGRLGRLAGANRVSRLGRLRGGPATRALAGRLWSKFSGLGMRGTSGGYVLNADGSLATDINANPIATPGYTPGSSIGIPGYGAGAASPGGITPTEAALLSNAITTAGKVGTQAIIGTPTLTYNPLTGTYSASGGATIPTSLVTSATISQYLPLILLAGGAVLLFSVMGRR